MMVKIHPHRNKVTSGDPMCVSVTPRGGRAYYMGSVSVKNARFVIHKAGVERARREKRRNVHAWCEGELQYESRAPQGMAYYEQYYDEVTYHYEVGRFMTLAGRDVTDETFSYAVCNGPRLFVPRS